MNHNPPRDEDPDWRQQAQELGVNPDEPDDAKYWMAMGRARALVNSFRYHKPTDDQVDRISEVRQAFIAAAKTVLRCAPTSADQTASLRQLHEAMMTANKAIALEPQK